MYAGQSMANAVGPLESARVVVAGDRGIFDQLREEHAAISSLLKQVRNGDVDTRRELYPRLRRELVAHGLAEDKEFYAILEHYRETELCTSHSRAAHDRVEQFIARLDELAIDDPDWDLAFDELATNVAHHIRVEEMDLIPAAQQLLSDDISEALARRFASQKAQELRLLEMCPLTGPFKGQEDSPDPFPLFVTSSARPEQS
jgi:hemerythrin-like domain-containing protein